MERKNVVMFVYNYFENDSRVLKEAATLSEHGYIISIFTLWKKGLEQEEKIDNDTTVYRLNVIPFHKRIFGEKFFNFLKKKIYSKSVTSQTKSTKETSSVSIPVNKKKTKINSLKFLLSTTNNYLTYWGYYSKAERKIKKLKIQPSIVHSHDLNTLPVGRKVSEKFKAKLVYDSHELYLHRNKPYQVPNWYHKFQFGIEKRHITKCNAVITVSQSIVDYLAETYSIPKPYLIMNAPVKQHKRELSSDNNLKSLLKIPEGNKLLIYSGGISFNRGLDKLIIALKKIDNCHLVFMGGGNKTFKDYLLKVAQENHVQDRFHFYGPVGSHDVSSYIQSADLGIAPIENVCLSYYYCAPNKVFEYIQGGIPVVSSNFPDMERVIKENNIGSTFDPDSPDEIANQITAIITNEELYKTYKNNVIAIVDKYKWENEEKKLIALYQELN